MITRTAFRRVSQHDEDYYNRYYPNNYPYFCHGCHQRIGAGQSFCHLIGASDDGSNVWGRCCAAAFERNESDWP